MTPVETKIKRFEKILQERLKLASSVQSRSAYLILLTHFRSMFSEELRLSDPNGSDQDSTQPLTQPKS